MINLFTFGGITSGSTLVEENKVDKVYDGLYFYNENFTHEEDGLVFNYSYVVEVLDKNEHDIDETIVTLFLVINEDSLCDTVKSAIKDCCVTDEIDTCDIMAYGVGAVKIAYEEIEEGVDIDEHVRKVLSLVPAINFMRGFYLDRAWNRIGTTGWDSINYAIGVTDELFNY